MILSFLFLNIAFIIFAIIVIKFHEYRKSLSVFLLILVTIFYTPAIYYYVMNGFSYRAFNNEALMLFMLQGGINFIVFSILLFLKRVKVVNISKRGNVRPTGNILVKFYICVIVIGILGFIIVNYESLPLFYTLITGSVLSVRPDVGGNIEGFIIFSTFLTLILPSYYFYYVSLPKNTNNTKTKIALLIILSILLIVGGNKGVLVFFYLFIWIFEYKFEINKRLVMMFIGAFTAYLFLKMGEIALNSESISYLISSPFRRFFVAQGSGFIVRLSLQESGFSFSELQTIKQVVYQIIYGDNIGSSPTYFLGDLIVSHGYLVANIIHFIVISSMVFLSKLIDKKFYGNLFAVWSFFSVTYLLGMAEIGRTFYYRLLAIILNFLIVIILDTIRFRNKPSKEKKNNINEIGGNS